LRRRQQSKASDIQGRYFFGTGITEPRQIENLLARLGKLFSHALVAQMAMVKTYRLGLALKFTGVVVAGMLSTGILVSIANAVWAPRQTGERRTVSRRRHIIFHPKNDRASFGWQNSISKTRR
jgi:hypothetical protein